MIQEKKQWGPPNASRSPADKIILFCFSRSTLSCLFCLLMDYSRLERSLSICFHQNHVLHLFSVAPACNALCPLPARPPSCRIEGEKKTLVASLFLFKFHLFSMFRLFPIYLLAASLELVCLKTGFLHLLLRSNHLILQVYMLLQLVLCCTYNFFQFNRHHFGFRQSQVWHMYLITCTVYCLEGK